MVSDIFRKITLHVASTTNQLSDLDKSHLKRGGPLKITNLRKNKSNISDETAGTVNFHLYKSMGTISCHSNQSSYPTGTKTQLFVPSTYRCYMCNLKRIGFTASEEKSFENGNDGRMTDSSIYYKLTYKPSDQVS